LNYNYDNRYLITATFRRDGTPYFGPGKKWGNFPSVSAAWRVNNESFFDVPAISDLKLRYEIGLTGNQGTQAGIYSRLATAATPWGTGFLPQELSNPNLQWEETQTENYGLNIGFLKNRFTIEADYYVKKTSNLILNASIPWYHGTGGVPGALTPPLYNTGNLETKGWNLTFNSTNINKKDFRWETNLNLSHFKSEVKQLTGDRLFLARTSWWMNSWTQWAHVGYEPWLFRGYIAEGLFQSQDELANSALPVDNNGNPRPIDPNNGIWVGDVKYQDQLTIDTPIFDTPIFDTNGDGILDKGDGILDKGDGIPDKADGKIDVNDETFIGNPWPKVTAGFTNTFSYKGFDLSILFTGTFGNDIYNYIAAVNTNPNNVNLSRNFLVNALNYAHLVDNGSGKVSIENSGTDVPRITSGQIASDNNYGKNSSRFVEDGSYIRLKNISLSYSLPARILGYSKVIKEMRITLGAQNLFTWTKYSGYDPEVGAYVGTGASGGGQGNQAIGIDFGRYPLTRMYTASINVNF
jgi:TonB-linked SusC/RagA family outer membrane protein